MQLDQARHLFTVITISGFVMLTLEIFLPGGILGMIGVMALIASMVLAFTAFPAYGAAVALVILVAGAVFMLLMLKLAPKTWLGKKLTIDTDLSASKGANESLEQYMGKQGVAACQLRPSGFAIIDKHRVDVITRGEMIDPDETIEVIEIESNRVVVKKV